MSAPSPPLPEQSTDVWHDLGAGDRDFIVMEVGKLRDEMTSRMTHQIQLVTLLVTGAGALVGLALSSKQYVLVLVVPIFGLGVGLLHVSLGSYVILMAKWIYKVEPETGYEHFVQSRCQPHGRSAKETSMARRRLLFCSCRSRAPGLSLPDSPQLEEFSSVRPDGSASGSRRLSACRSPLQWYLACAQRIGLRRV
jgi:hypothetical protein